MKTSLFRFIVIHVYIHRCFCNVELFLCVLQFIFDINVSCSTRVLLCEYCYWLIALYLFLFSTHRNLENLKLV